MFSGHVLEHDLGAVDEVTPVRHAFPLQKCRTKGFISGWQKKSYMSTSLDHRIVGWGSPVPWQTSANSSPDSSLSSLLPKVEFVEFCGSGLSPSVKIRTFGGTENSKNKNKMNSVWTIFRADFTDHGDLMPQEGGRV